MLVVVFSATFCFNARTFNFLQHQHLTKMQEHLKETEVTERFEKRHDRAFSKQSRICIKCMLESTCSVT